VLLIKQLYSTHIRGHSSHNLLTQILCGSIPWQRSYPLDFIESIWRMSAKLHWGLHDVMLALFFANVTVWMAQAIYTVL